MTYEGSLTQPGCHETVSWIVFNKPLYITVEHVSIDYVSLTISPISFSVFNTSCKLIYKSSTLRFVLEKKRKLLESVQSGKLTSTKLFKMKSLKIKSFRFS